MSRLPLVVMSDDRAVTELYFSIGAQNPSVDFRASVAGHIYKVRLGIGTVTVNQEVARLTTGGSLTVSAAFPFVHHQGLGGVTEFRGAFTRAVQSCSHQAASKLRQLQRSGLIEEVYE